VSQLKEKPKITTSYRGGNCVSTLKQAGILKCTDCSPTDMARDIPTNLKSLEDGKCAVVVTTESRAGHVLYGCKQGGNIVSVVEGGYVGGQGRVVSPDVVIGYRL